MFPQVVEEENNNSRIKDMSPIFLTILAQSSSLSQFYKPARVLQGTSLAEFIQPFVNAIIVIAALAAFGSAIMAGVRYIASAGDVKQTQNATNMLTYSLLGLAIAIVAFVVTRVLFQIGGAEGLF